MLNDFLQGTCVFRVYCIWLRARWDKGGAGKDAPLHGGAQEAKLLLF